MVLYIQISYVTLVYIYLFVQDICIFIITLIIEFNNNRVTNNFVQTSVYKHMWHEELVEE